MKHPIHPSYDFIFSSFLKCFRSICLTFERKKKTNKQNVTFINIARKKILFHLVSIYTKTYTNFFTLKNIYLDENQTHKETIHIHTTHTEIQLGTSQLNNNKKRMIYFLLFFLVGRTRFNFALKLIFLSFKFRTSYHTIYGCELKMSTPLINLSNICINNNDSMTNWLIISNIFLSWNQKSKKNSLVYDFPVFEKSKNLKNKQSKKKQNQWIPNEQTEKIITQHKIQKL